MDSPHGHNGREYYNQLFSLLQITKARRELKLNVPLILDMESFPLLYL